jgi:hypothetical protein
MAQFATANELAARLGITLAGDEAARANTLLTLASGLIQGATRQRIERVENDVLAIRGLTEGRILLPERPVISVSAVSLNGETVNAGDYYLDGDSLVRGGSGWTAWLDAQDFGGGRWGSSRTPLTVTYTHGYETIPGAIKTVCIESAVRAYVNPGSVEQESYGSERTSYGAVGLTLTPDERSIVRRAVSRGAESLAIR